MLSSCFKGRQFPLQFQYYPGSGLVSKPWNSGQKGHVFITHGLNKALDGHTGQNGETQFGSDAADPKQDSEDPPLFF